MRTARARAFPPCLQGREKASLLWGRRAHTEPEQTLGTVWEREGSSSIRHPTKGHTEVTRAAGGQRDLGSRQE